jgi:hypothetical protein
MENETPEIKKDEPKMPNPQEANNRPDVDMRNEVRKGGEVPNKK